VRRVDTEAIRALLDRQTITLVPTLGYSPTGETFNLGLETTAVAVARALKADKLIAFVDDDGLRDRDGKLLREMTHADIAQLPDNHLWDIATLASVTANGVERCHLISYQHNGALLVELFSRDGAGTLITAAPYERIRPASIDDIAGIVGLIEPLEAAGVLVHRSRELLETDIHHFTVVERDGVVIGCAALFSYPSANTGEIACVVSHPDYRGSGRALALLAHLEKQARAAGLSSVFVLTTQTAHWFREQGFVPAALDMLPPEKQALYNYQRNSKVFQKTLS
jgi:amino-acid N-acetyltransferase